MNLQQFADYFQPITCVLRIERFPDGSYGNIRIMSGNQAYIRLAEYVTENSSLKPVHFVPDTPYEKYIPKDFNFEEMCFQCAVNKKPLHTYIHPERFDFWLNVFMLPLTSNEENYFYCTYTQEFAKQADTNIIAGNISAETAVDVLRTCIKLRGTQNFKQTMQEIIQDIHALCNSRRCCILMTDFQNQTCSVLCEAKTEQKNVQSVREYIQEGFYDIVKTWPDMVAGSTCLILRNEKDMEWVREKNPVWYASLMEKHVTSMVLFPLKSGEETIGFLWATNFDTENTTHIRETLELTVYFIGAEIAGRQLLRELEVLSSMDSLTGVYNRNRMNQRVDTFLTEESNAGSLGIVFADLNGLKTVNDNQGHSAGDALLRKAGKILKKIFFDSEIYRAGGDEFMILIQNTTKQELQSRAGKLRKQKNISFAVGCYFDPSGKEIKQAMRIADKNMYQDKRLYYQNHPEQKQH